MRTIEVHNRVSDFDSYRSARVKSLFNAESGCNFDLTIEGVDFAEGWELTTRKTINAHGDISEAFNMPVCQILYAELEREPADFEEVTT